MKDKNTKLKEFFEALYKAEPEAFEAIVNPMAYKHFKNIEAVASQEVHEHIKDWKFYHEYRPEVQQIITMTVGATIDILEDIFTQAKKRRELLQKGQENE